MLLFMLYLEGYWWQKCLEKEIISLYGGYLIMRKGFKKTHFWWIVFAGRKLVIDKMW